MLKLFRNLLKKMRIFLDTKINGEKFLSASFRDKYHHLSTLEIRLKNGKEIKKLK